VQFDAVGGHATLAVNDVKERDAADRRGTGQQPKLARACRAAWSNDVALRWRGGDVVALGLAGSRWSSLDIAGATLGCTADKR
jgi:hypothetical protein